MTENLVTGKKYRVLVDAASDLWDRMSFWTKASDVYYNDNTTVEENKPVGILKRSTIYNVGDIAYEPTAPSWAMLKCTKSGMTDAEVGSRYRAIQSVGAVVNDGSAKFVVYDVCPSSTLSDSAYQIPAMSLLQNFDSALTSSNNKRFQFAFENEKYGFMVDDEFVSFSTSFDVANCSGQLNSSSPYTVNQDGVYLLAGSAIDTIRNEYSVYPNITLNLYLNGSTISGKSSRRALLINDTRQESHSIENPGNKAILARAVYKVAIANCVVGDKLSGSATVNDGSSVSANLKVFRIMTL